jgi:hypothetical protein
MTVAHSDGYHLYQQPFPSGDYAFVQLAFVVDDVIESARQWADLYGAGPFYVLPRRALAGTYRGRPSQVETRIGVSQLGPLQVELIEVRSEEPSAYDEPPRSGPGPHHLATVTERYDAAMAHYGRLGRPAVMELESGGARIAYVDTRAAVGLYTEVIEHSDTFVRALRGTARACASWDGTDPVRLLRDGGGYDVPPAA